MFTQQFKASTDQRGQHNEVPTELTIYYKLTLRRGWGVPQCNIVTKMHLATIALLCKQTIDYFQTSPLPKLLMAPSIG